jgi:hypothetical protein
MHCTTSGTLGASAQVVLILPGHPPYDTARQVWNRAIDRRPAAIVRAESVDEIRRTIEWARTDGLPLAVRSGGHSQAGHGTCDGGIVLDLGALRAIEVDADRRTARVAAGARVSDVQDATQARGLLTPMGGCKEVGIGGLTLGGGENFLMGTYGMVCDNVVRAEVVLADGRLVIASEEEHADLFWAIRGGGGNFGVVTSFDYRLYPVFDVLFGQLLFPLTRTREVMRIYRDLIASAPDELDTSCGLSPDDDAAAFSVNVCFCGGPAEGNRILERFRAALEPADDTVKWSPYCADLVIPATPSSGTGVFLSGLHDEVIDAFASAVLSAPPAASAVFSHFHGAVTRVPQNAMAFPLRQPGFDLFISVPWETAEARARAEDWMTALRPLRAFGCGVYVNNLNQDEADRVREAYGPNYARLAEIKEIYDPENVWRINHNVGPLGC